jgi:MoaA/NifB/PqqE/SkfB family radical SAM enzyme
MKESAFKKCCFYAYSVSVYVGVALSSRFSERQSHRYFIDSKMVKIFYQQYGLANIFRAAIRAPKNLNLSTTGYQIFKNAYLPKHKKTVLSTSIEVTNNCPYRCKGCYIDIEKRKSDFFMSENILRQTIESLHYVTSILIQGGEPLQKNSVDMLYRVLKDYPDQIFVIVTTGVYISKYGIGKFAELNNIVWSISINGTEEVNDKVRFKGSFKHAINAMDKIREAQQYFVATVTLSKDNVEDATSEVFVRLLALKGVKEIRYLILREAYNQLSLDEVEYYEKKIKEYNKYVLCNFSVDNIEDYCVIDPDGNKRDDRTGYDHTLKYNDESSAKKHNF